MKQIFSITILLLCCAAYAAQAQQIHFTDTSNRWGTMYTFFNDAGEGFTYYPRYAIKDTVFNEEYGYMCASYLDEYPLFLTEDTTAKKVYARKMYDSDTARFILYDFNIAVGDSILMTLRYDTTTIAHICLESYPDVLINGIPHRAVFMLAGGLGYWVIEGIGSQIGPLQPFKGGEEWMPELICFENNGSEPEFSSIFSNACYLSVDNQQASAPTITLAPNPASDLLHISSSRVGIYTYFIYDITGRQVYQGILKEEATLDIANWQSGMYIVRIIDEKGNTAIRKFIKH